MFDNDDLQRNDAIYELDFDGQHIDTGKWPDSRWQISPRIGFVWDVFKDKSLKVRGGTGVFTGRLPLVFFTNMPTNASMVQNSVTFKTQYDNGKVVGHDSRLDQLAGGMITDMNQIIDKFNLPTTIEKHVAGKQDFRCGSGLQDAAGVEVVYRGGLSGTRIFPLDRDGRVHVHEECECRYHQQHQYQEPRRMEVQ